MSKRSASQQFLEYFENIHPSEYDQDIFGLFDECGCIAHHWKKFFGIEGPVSLFDIQRRMEEAFGMESKSLTPMIGRGFWAYRYCENGFLRTRRPARGRRQGGLRGRL